ncbi:glycoside hydrolase family 95 protein [Clostridium sp. DSM 100503]|uniref:glycoside hydrolase family 95 protein n=1 Tax=Clostridium sp. DSM 100503 TaxID=2963282 RepID=UPI002149CF73|nr:glycoside hydrolase family 95 protein [Clostridium sp. DSM 100503]MCR1950648.1 glycoside hydrolase family 95 protein [Clostridium sp. DSM 100503]
MSKRLWYKEKAEEWVEALPLGNGSLGAMVLGDVFKERIALNEDTLWTGIPKDKTNYEAKKYLDKARELIDKEEYFEAQKLMNEKMLSGYTESYAPLGDLYLDFYYEDEKYSNYTRELDLDKALVTVKYNIGNTEFKREAFVSAKDKVLVIKITSTKDQSLNFDIRLNSLLKSQSNKDGDIGLVLKGIAPIKILPSYVSDETIIYDENNELGTKFCTRIRIKNKDGKVNVNEDILEVRNSSEAILILSASTNFEEFNIKQGSAGRDEKALSEIIINNAEKLSYDELFNNHFKEYSELFDRVEFRLGKEVNRNNENENKNEKGQSKRKNENTKGQWQNILKESKDREVENIEELPTDERLKRLKNGEEDLGLITLYFHYGRYLLISSSRRGSEPANLQGIWNEEVRPPWSSNYTININTEMNYWPAEVCNISECHEPLLNMIKDLSISGEKTAREEFNCEGWTANHNVDIWRYSNTVLGSCEWGYWPMGGPWICQHIFEHYDFTRDKEFLKEYYPILKGSASFLLSWLREDSKGVLNTCPSTSPENNFLDNEGRACCLSKSSTMDIAITRDLFRNCIEASKILEEDEYFRTKYSTLDKDFKKDRDFNADKECNRDVFNEDKEFRDKLITSLEKLPSYKINKHGGIQEWYKDFDEKEPGHRHISHLFGLYPGKEITEYKNKDLIEACKNTLSRRLSQGGGHTGWSCAWIINFYARLKEPELANKYLNILLSKLTYSNLFCVHPPFQIDGNFGGTAGIAEMLIQSHQGYIEILPAIPKSWKSGEVKGLRARGGYTVDISWKDNKLIYVNIISDNDGICEVHYSKYLSQENEIGNKNNVCNYKDVITFEAKKGSTYTIVGM